MASGWGWPLALGASLTLAVGTALAVVSVRNEREYERFVLAGDAALGASDLSAAIEAYTGAITLRADSMAAHLKRGLAYRQRGEPEAALRDLRRAAELDPTAPRVFEWQGDVNAGLGRHARAAERYEQSLALDDRQAEVLYKLAVARYREGRAGAAIDPLRRAVALAPGLAEAHYLLGVSLRDAGRLDEAFTALNTAARLSPGLLEAREARVDVLQARGDTARAVDELAALAALEPERPERAVAVGAAYARAGRHDAAVLSLGRAAERFPESSAVFGALGAVWLRAAESGDAVALDKAIAALRHGAELGDPSAETWLALGRARALAGDLDGADATCAVPRASCRHRPTPTRDWPTCSSASGAGQTHAMRWSTTSPWWPARRPSARSLHGSARCRCASAIRMPPPIGTPRRLPKAGPRRRCASDWPRPRSIAARPAGPARSSTTDWRWSRRTPGCGPWPARSTPASRASWRPVHAAPSLRKVTPRPAARGDRRALTWPVAAGAWPPVGAVRAAP